MAVDLFFLHHPGSLTLYLPCPWDYDNTCFHDTKQKDWRVNPGQTANLYHKRFGQVLGRDTLRDIYLVEVVGARLDTTHFGFHNRNTPVAKSELLIAFTWGNDISPGGTRDTWQKCSGKRVHVNLMELRSSGRAARRSAGERPF